MILRSARARTVFMVVVALCAASPALADSDLPETVVVSATRTPTDLSKIGSSISVITAKDIKDQQAVFVTDILQDAPGVVVNQTGPRGADSSIQLRGAPTEGTFVLIDGVEVSDPSRTQTAFDFSQLTTQGIDRIEILRGSQSVLYGGDAVGGVISITTKRGSGDLDGLVYGERGSYGTYLLGGSARGGLDGDRFGYNVNVQYLGSDGFSAADSNLPGNTEADRYHNISTNGRFDYAISDDVDLKAVYRYAGGLLNYDACGGPFCDESDIGDYFHQYSGRVSSEFRLFDGMFTGEVGAAFARDDRTNFDNGGSDYFDIGEREQFDFKGAVNFDPDNIVVFGAETKRDFSHTDSDPKTESNRNTGYYAEYQAGFFNALYTTLGIRVDDNERFGAFTTYRGTLVYDIAATDTKLKGSYSTGFRAPSLFELFGVCCGDPMLGNPALKPQTSRSWDIGAEQQLLDGEMKLGVTYFRLDAGNIIQFGGLFGTPAPNYFNIPGTSASDGIEASVDWHPLAQLALNFAYTYNNAEDATGARLTERPRHLFNLNANYAFLDDRANANLDIRYMSDTADDDFSTFPSTTVNLGSYAVVNFGLSYRVFEQTELYGRVENLFDQKYETEFGYGTAGQSFYFGIRQKV